MNGRYDFTVRQTPPSPDDNHVYSYSVDHLGLRAEPGTENRPMLVLKHTEKPTEN